MVFKEQEGNIILSSTREKNYNGTEFATIQDHYTPNHNETIQLIPVDITKWKLSLYFSAFGFNAVSQIILMNINFSPEFRLKP